MTKIDMNVNRAVNQIITEMNQVILERHDVIRGFWVGRIAQLHMVLLGAGGTGKSFLCRNAQDRIIGGTRFEGALDETTDPSRVFGPIDVKALAEQGKSRVVTTGMLPEATDAFIDEIMNANAPVKHSLQPILNERIFHNNGMPTLVPLRQMIAGTNVNNADTDPHLAPFFDRLHMRFTVDYLAARDNQAQMVAQAIARLATIGRGTGTQVAGPGITTVTLEQLDQAHREALNLDVDDPVMNLFLDIREELKGNGILISDRRMVEGMAAVLANAWVRGHETVQSGDLDVLSCMWWSLQETESTARGIILGATNPGEKAAMDLLEELDKLKQELADASASGVDDDRKRRLGVEAVRNADKLINDAQGHLNTALAAGGATQRLSEVVERALTFKTDIGRQIFGLDLSANSPLARAGA